MSLTAELLDQQLRAAGVPITGVSIGNDADKGTWHIRFEPGVTPEQEATAAGIVAAYVDPKPNTLLDKFAEQRIGEKALIATAQALWECIPAPTMTKVQLKTRAKAIFKNGNGS